MVGRRSSYFPLVCYVVGVGIFNCVAFFIGFFVFVQWMYFFTTAAIVGQILFCLLLGGLLSDYWLKGLVIGTSLLVCWALCLLLGTQWFGRIGLILTPDFFWYLFALPAIILGGSTPLLICRSAFGWKLIRANARSSQSRFSVEDLLLTTAAIASVLFMCRVPQIATERPPNIVLAFIAYGIAFSFVATLVILIPTAYIAFRYKVGRQRRLGYGLLFGVIYGAFLSLLIAPLIAPVGLTALAYAFAVPLGLFVALLLGLKALRMSGYELASRARKAELSSTEVDEQAIPVSKRTQRRWALGVLAFAAISSLSLMTLDTFKLRFERELFELNQTLQKRGDSMDVLGRMIVELKLSPSTTDETLEDLQGFQDVQTLSLANTQITDAGLKSLSKFPRLNSLDLSQTSISDAGLVELRKLKNLQHLSLAHTQVTVSKLTETKSLMNCMSLDVSGLKVTDDQLPLLARSNTRAEYRHLVLRDNLLTDSGLANYFKANPVWATLDLSGNPIDGSCIAELRNVSTLVLENIPLTDAIIQSAISPTGFFGPTKKMVLSGNQVTSVVLNSVGPGVELGESGITESQLRNCNVQGFTRLILKGKSFDGSCFSTWHPRVFELGLRGTGVTDETIRFLRNITGLQIIDLSDTEVTDACLPELRNVLYINLSGTKITYDGLRAASFARPQRIQIALGQFSVEEVRELKKSLPLVVGKSGD